MTIGLFIGRFQPFHKAHLADVINILRDCDEVLIGIGSSQEKNTKDNPFSVEERTRMIEDTLYGKEITTFSIFPIPDINDDQKWVDHCIKLLPKFDIVYSGNEKTLRLFKKNSIKTIRIKLILGVNATEIRKSILHGNDWDELVPEKVVEYIVDISGIERIKEINK